jgi:hypothetical protein
VEGTPFEARVRSLREGWAERRESGLLARSHDFESQNRILANVHRWASDCIEDVRHVYGETLSITIDHLDERGHFGIAVGDAQRAAFELVDRGNEERPSWQVVARVAAGGEAGEAPEERRVRHWRRSQVEEILLSLVSAHERSLSREVSA